LDLRYSEQAYSPTGLLKEGKELRDWQSAFGIPQKKRSGNPDYQIIGSLLF